MNEKDRKYYEDLYKELSQKYTKQELVESFVFPSMLSDEEEKKAAKELWEHRKSLLENRTEEEKIYANLLKLKYEIEDGLVLAEKNKTTSSVSCFLKAYIKSIGSKQKNLASDLAIHTTRLSRIINGRERLSLSLAYRLEKHSGGLIPALLWWKLVQKEVEAEIESESQHRIDEMNKVKSVAYASAI